VRRVVVAGLPAVLVLFGCVRRDFVCFGWVRGTQLRGKLSQRLVGVATYGCGLRSGCLP
jgi:hypothetical protein